MDLFKIILNVIFLKLANSLIIENNEDIHDVSVNDINKTETPDNVFNGVYTECFLNLSYTCLQKKTLLYLKELNNLSEVSVIGDYVKFVRVNATISPDDESFETGNTDELSILIDKAVDNFFDNHVLKFNALGRDISIPRNIGEFVGRKKRKGGGGGGEGMGGHGHDDKKKMMMMAMMCMKMKLMMMVPAMMGMMGMMSFKGMIFSMMSFMISKILLLMKILEKKGGAGGLGASGAGGDGGWAATGLGAGGSWMPAGGQDLGGGGYDANGQWQSRSMAESLDVINKPIVYYTNINNRKIYPELTNKHNNDDLHWDNSKFSFNTVLERPNFKLMPEISYVKPIVRFNNKIDTEVYKKPVLVYKKSNVDFNNYADKIIDIVESDKEEDIPKYINSRAKRSTHDMSIEDFNQGNREKSEIKHSDKEIIEKITNTKESLRKKRSILDLLQNSYTYWMTKLLGLNNNRRTNFQKYKIINGVRYVYYPFKFQKTKTPREVQLLTNIKSTDDIKPIVTAVDFNKGEIIEGGFESRMHRKKFSKIKETVNDTVEDNPWE